MAAFQSTSAPQPSKATTTDVVEIGLLLPTSRVNALIELSKRKQQSVGQLLRNMIDRELADRSDDGFDAFEANGLGTFV